ncbi:unnamed protein product [Rhizophagus irregularis]|nr:unnamed protein product [Rhizophagus irregularis]
MKKLCKFLFPIDNLGSTVARIVEILLDSDNQEYILIKLGLEFPPEQNHLHRLQTAITLLNNLGVTEIVCEEELRDDKMKQNDFKTHVNSANELIRETLIPSSGSNVTTLLQQINEQKPQQSSTTSTTKSHMYPFHHHYPHKTNLINENFEDGNEIIGFLNSDDYTNQVYNEEFNQTTLNGKRRF